MGLCGGGCRRDWIMDSLPSDSSWLQHTLDRSGKHNIMSALFSITITVKH